MTYGWCYILIIGFSKFSFTISQTQQCPCNKPPTCFCVGSSKASSLPPVDKANTGVVEEFFRKFSLASLGRCKRETLSFIYPHPGKWYKDTASGKYYFVRGKTIYVQRCDKLYSRWVSSGENNWVMGDNFNWLWDNNGIWYPVKEVDQKKPSSYCERFEIPLSCIGTECPEQIRFPSDGIWSFDAGNVIFKPERKNFRYELQSNGLFRKMRGFIVICPQNWTWNTSTAKWTPVDGDDNNCEKEPEEGNIDIQGENMEVNIKLPREIFEQ